jgi:hypothetical protein
VELQPLKSRMGGIKSPKVQSFQHRQGSRWDDDRCNFVAQDTETNGVWDPFWAFGKASMAAGGVQVAALTFQIAMVRQVGCMLIDQIRPQPQDVSFRCQPLTRDSTNLSRLNTKGEINFDSAIVYRADGSVA